MQNLHYSISEYHYELERGTVNSLIVKRWNKRRKNMTETELVDVWRWLNETYRIGGNNASNINIG